MALKKEKIKNENKRQKLPQRDDLRMKAMAQYKVLKDADVLQFEMVENKLLEKPVIKGLALSSDSIQKFELFKANKMYESENLSMEDSEFYLKDNDEDSENYYDLDDYYIGQFENGELCPRGQFRAKQTRPARTRFSQ